MYFTIIHCHHGLHDKLGTTYVLLYCKVSTLTLTQSSTSRAESEREGGDEELPEELPESMSVVGVDDNIHTKSLQQVIDEVSVRSKFTRCMHVHVHVGFINSYVASGTTQADVIIVYF